MQLKEHLVVSTQENQLQIFCLRTGAETTQNDTFLSENRSTNCNNRPSYLSENSSTKFNKRTYFCL